MNISTGKTKKYINYLEKKNAAIIPAQASYLELVYLPSETTTLSIRRSNFTTQKAF